MRARAPLFVVIGALAIGGVVLAAWLGGRSLHPGAPTRAATGPPPPVTLRVIFPEGFTRAQMAQRIGAVRQIAIRKRHVRPRLTVAGYLAASVSARAPQGFRRAPGSRSLEGFLFPATYDFVQSTTARQLVADQLAAFREAFSTVTLRYARSKNLTPYDVLKIASMIEKEAVVPSERPLIAAVIYNRLRLHMPLGIDATIRYGLRIPATRSLTKVELASSSPYNSRRFPGLPPTPIANPGLPSLRAAAHPAHVGYLYYVRKPGSLHHFFTADAQTFFRKECEYGYGCS
jgi:UPF0755 protein